MLWMITDLSMTPSLEKSIEHISLCLYNGTEKVTLRNYGVLSNDEVAAVKEYLDKLFPQKEIYIHDPITSDFRNYAHFHFPSHRIKEACDIKKKFPSVKVAISTHSQAEYEEAFRHGIDAAFFSPVFQPVSKPDDIRKTVKPVKMKNLYLLGGMDRMKAIGLIKKGFTNIAGISLFYGENAASVIKELSTLIKEKEYGISDSN